MAEDIYKRMVKDFFEVITKNKAYSALDNTKRLRFLRKELDTAFAYAVTEGEETRNCNGFRAICHYFGIDIGRWGGSGLHYIDRFLEETKVHSETIDNLIKKYDRKNLGVVFTERKLDEEKSKIISELGIDFGYLGILKFDKDGEIESFDPE